MNKQRIGIIIIIILIGLMSIYYYSSDEKIMIRYSENDGLGINIIKKDDTIRDVMITLNSLEWYCDSYNTEDETDYRFWLEIKGDDSRKISYEVWIKESKLVVQNINTRNYAFIYLDDIKKFNSYFNIETE